MTVVLRKYNREDDFRVKYGDEIPDFEGEKCFDCGHLQWGASFKDMCDECGVPFDESRICEGCGEIDCGDHQ